MRPRWIRAAMLCSAAAAAMAPAVALAQTTPTATPQSGEPTAVGEIIVTAQRRAERLQDVPISVTARSGAELKALGISDTRALSQTVPGLTFTSQGAWAEPNLRGVSTQNSGAGEESPIAIYVDGVYQVSQVASLFQLPDVSQLEVLKGPQGTLFGRNAEGGAILIQTKDPTFKPSGNIDATAGYFTGNGGSHSSPEYGASGFLSAPLVDDKLAGSFSFYDDHIDGYLNNIQTGRSEGLIENQIYRAKLLYTPTQNMRFLLTGYYSLTRDNADNAPSALDDGSDLTLISGSIVPTKPWNTAHDYPVGILTKTYGVNLQSTYSFEQGTLTSLTAYSHVSNDIRIDVQAGYLAPAQRPHCYTIYSCIDYVVSQPADSISQEFVWTSKKYDRFNYVAGVFLFDSDERQEQYINQYVSDAVHNDDKVVTKSAAFFAQGDYDILSNLTATLGGRVSYENKQGSYAVTYPGPLSPTVSPSWTSFTPRASLKYKFDNANNVYFTYSQGFKSGVINPGEPFNVAAPEKLYAYELGFKHSSSAFSASASLFYYDYTNLQIQSYQVTKFITTNAAKATIFGLDGEASLRVTPELTLRLSGSYLPEAKYDNFDNAQVIGRPLTASGYPEASGDVSGDRLLKTPKFEGTFATNYRKAFDIGLIEATASVYYTTAFDWEFNYLIKTQAHAIVNGEVALTPAGSHLRMSLWGKNLSNTAYVSGELNGDAVANMAVYAPPREVGITFGYKF